MEILTYRQISFDTAHIAPGQQLKATFFDASPYQILDGSARITDFDEKPMVRWLMLAPSAGSSASRVPARLLASRRLRVRALSLIATDTSSPICTWSMKLTTSK